MIFGDILAELRHDHGWLQRDLAAKLNIAVSTVSNYETGVHFPDPENLIRIADCFDVSLDYLLGRTKLQVDTTKFTRPISDSQTLGDLVERIEKLNDKEVKTLIEFVELLELRGAHKP